MRRPRGSRVWGGMRPPARPGTAARTGTRPPAGAAGTAPSAWGRGSPRRVTVTRGCPRPHGDATAPGRSRLPRDITLLTKRQFPPWPPTTPPFRRPPSPKGHLAPGTSRDPQGPKGTSPPPSQGSSLPSTGRPGPCPRAVPTLTVEQAGGDRQGLQWVTVLGTPWLLHPHGVLKPLGGLLTPPSPTPTHGHRGTPAAPPPPAPGDTCPQLVTVPWQSPQAAPRGTGHTQSVGDTVAQGHGTEPRDTDTACGTWHADTDMTHRSGTRTRM